jgi:Ferritin-like domain
MSYLRKGAIAGGVALSGAAILSALVPGVALASARPPATFGKGDIGILSFALTREYLERAFYNEATAKARSPTPRRAPSWAVRPARLIPAGSAKRWHTILKRTSTGCDPDGSVAADGA